MNSNYMPLKTQKAIGIDERSEEDTAFNLSTKMITRAY